MKTEIFAKKNVLMNTKRILTSAVRSACPTEGQFIKGQLGLSSRLH